VEAFICIIACIGLLIIPYGLSFILPESLKKPILSVSRNVNSIYCIHWVLVWWTVDVFLYCSKAGPYLSSGPAYLLGLGLSILSMLLAQIWSQLKIKYKRKTV